uniref:Large ribosomal subunit protein eL19 n=1 Tax=Acartia pacifica TaxID=335913 RepID=R9TEV5_ACAPC|nr:60S ribosomal protein L19 [Acartia pacifica]
MAVNLTFQRRLAAKVLNVGKNKVWMDPECSSTIASCTSSNTIRKLCKDSIIVPKTVNVHSRYHANKRVAEKKKGRHMGLGKRKGAKNARCNKKTQYVRHIRALRHTLTKYYGLKKIDSSVKRNLRSRVKGNEFKSKKSLIETIIKMRNVANEEKEQAKIKQQMVQKAADKGLKKTKAHEQKIMDKIQAIKSKVMNGQKA